MKDLYFISVNPEIGKILWERKTIFRLHAGIDYAFYITGEDEAAFYRPTLVSYGYQSVPGKNDVRLTAGASFTWRKWTLAATYKYGLTNYRNDDNRQVYSRLLQWKLMYSVWRKPGKNDTGRK
jgi:hypothetical protein